MKKKWGILPMVALAAFIGCGGEGDAPTAQDPIESDNVEQVADVDVDGDESPSADVAAVTFVSLKVPNMV